MDLDIRITIFDNINDIITKSNFTPDVIILGHAWLNDRDGDEIDPHPNLKLQNTNIFKVALFNKEYTNLNQKIKYIKNNKFNLGFTHHHDLSLFKKSETSFVFWPFAYDSNKFNFKSEHKMIDIGFSGILQNLNKNAFQSDIRIRIMNSFFFSYFDVPLIKKNKFKDLNIFWNSISRSAFGRYLSLFLKKRKFLNDIEYADLIQNSKMFINTLSPMGLISPHFLNVWVQGRSFSVKNQNYMIIYFRMIFMLV